MSKKIEINLEVFKKYVEDFKLKNNRTPGLRDLYINKGCPYNKSSILKEYGNLSELYELIGEERCVPSFITSKSKDDLGSELLKAIYKCRSTDRDILRQECKIQDRSVYKRIFGSWSKALEFIGFDNRHRTLILYFRNYSGEDPINFLKNNIGLNGDFTKEQYDLINSTKPGIRMISKLFDKKSIFQIACGETPKSISGVTMKHLAKDGHYCDSEREMIVDNFLHENNLNHDTHVNYPGSKMKCDFKIADVYVEYAGYSTGSSKRIERYKEKIKKKIDYSKENNIKLLIIYKTDNESLNKLKNDISGLIQ